MTWGNPPPFKSVPSVKTGKKITPEQLAGDSEHSQQVALFAWAADSVGKYPPLKFMFAVPNGFYGDSGQKGKMKAEGLRSGVLDVFLPFPVAGIDKDHNGNRYIMYAGCFIEMKVEKHRKAKNGGCSDEQIEFMLYCGAAGYFAKVCYNWMEARDTLIAYLEGKC